MWEKSCKSKRMFTALGIQVHSYWYPYEAGLEMDVGRNNNKKKQLKG